MDDTLLLLAELSSMSWSTTMDKSSGVRVGRRTLRRAALTKCANDEKNAALALGMRLSMLRGSVASTNIVSVAFKMRVGDGHVDTNGSLLRSRLFLPRRSPSTMRSLWQQWWNKSSKGRPKNSDGTGSLYKWLLTVRPSRHPSRVMPCSTSESDTVLSAVPATSNDTTVTM